MTEEKGEEVAAEKSFAIKSAYDRDERRSKDTAMFGYESLSKGMELLFSVEIDDDNLEKTVVDALIGERRVGRSRTAQYGLVEIEQCSFPDTESYHDDELTVIYADSRLIFLDDNGQPTFRPTVEQLLGKGAKGQISWEDCQLRTFQYSPWNYKRQCYDTDRCGIEKGSVFVIRHTGKSYDGYSCVGSYQNEGFGIIVFNPVFMLRGGSNGLSKCKFIKEQTQPTNKQYTSTPTVQSPLFQYLIRQAENERKDKTIYKRVNEWKASSLFIGKEKFASQWGAIRSIALQCKDDDEIAIKVNEFISHGVKAENWYGKRADALREFMEENKGNLWAAIINLASEMAKKCVK
ncbi:MAG: hypothetical protein HUJ98_12845 [Bacteroidaceae bacterium]|nr:hypothetical protein [Bacteroidaceae bacterium]